MSLGWRLMCEMISVKNIDTIAIKMLQKHAIASCGIC